MSAVTDNNTQALREPTDETLAYYIGQCMDGWVGDVAEILDRRPDFIERTYSTGYTGLMYAVLGGNNEVVDLFIERKAPLDVTNDDHMTALLYTIHRGQLSMARKLMAAGADVTISDDRNCGALSYAAKYGHPSLMGELIERGADINQQDSKGFTPLMYAISYGYIECVKELLKCWPKLDLVDNEQRDALALAREHSRNKMIDLLNAEPQRRIKEAAENITQLTATGVSQPVAAQRLVLTPKR